MRLGETRYSFTQYTAGGLFRWVEYGEQSLTDWEVTVTRCEMKRKVKKDAERWDEWLGKFSTLVELNRPSTAAT